MILLYKALQVASAKIFLTEILVTVKDKSDYTVFCFLNVMSFYVILAFPPNWTC